MQRNKLLSFFGIQDLGFIWDFGLSLQLHCGSEHKSHPWAEVHLHLSLHLKDLSVLYHGKNHSQTFSRRRLKFSQKTAINEKEILNLWEGPVEGEWRFYCGTTGCLQEPGAILQAVERSLTCMLAWELIPHIHEKACLLINQLNK